MSIPSKLLADTQAALPVALICTERSAFITCRPDEVTGEVAARHPDFDHLPVVIPINEDDRVVGIFDAFKFRGDANDQLIGDHFSTLTEEQLIGADAAILDFIRAGDVHSCRLVVSGTRVTGLVTLSDLQALPVRAALFGLVTQLEMSLRDLIRAEFPESDDWQSRLSQGRQDRLAEEVGAAKAGDAFTELLAYTQFADKADIVRKSPDFVGSRTNFKEDMSEAQKLRNGLAHANQYASTRDDALKLCDTVRRIADWIEQLSKLQSKYETAVTLH